MSAVSWIRRFAGLSAAPPWRAMDAPQKKRRISRRKSAFAKDRRARYLHQRAQPRRYQKTESFSRAGIASTKQQRGRLRSVGHGNPRINGRFGRAVCVCVWLSPYCISDNFGRSGGVSDKFNKRTFVDIGREKRTDGAFVRRSGKRNFSCRHLVGRSVQGKQGG